MSPGSSAIADSSVLFTAVPAAAGSAGSSQHMSENSSSSKQVDVTIGSSTYKMLICSVCDSCMYEDVIFCPARNKFETRMVLAADELGSTRIEWLMHDFPDGSSLVPNSHVAEVRESCINLAKGNQKSYWETTFDD
ncbi:unnamed protein product [Caenorhabditis brenneri]